MKRNFLLLLFFMAICSFAIAQQQVRGIVTNEEDGQPMIGVTVLQKGTTNGTVTDFDGSYAISVKPGDILEFSYTGYTTKEMTVGAETEINVLLSPGVQLSEVVVTALGIQRDEKALAYSVTEVGGESFQEAREVNIANSLAGKVAGVNVSRIASGPAGSSRVVIRGNVSLGGNNQPLYVIDGVPIDNSGFGQAGLWGGADEGDGTSSINPDDIETLTVLKGANAAALYGSRASNGVILITTKSGKSRKGVGIEFNSNLVFDQVLNDFDFQDQYGHGRQGRKPADSAEAWDVGPASWGARLDGSNVAQFDGVSRPYVFQADENFNRFYDVGTTFTNSLGFSGGNENQTVRLNISDMNSKGVIPESGFTRRNASLSYNGKYGKRLTITSKVLYSNEGVTNRPNIADSPGNAPQGLLRLPVSYNVDDLKGDPNKLGAVPEGFVPPDRKRTGEELQISTDLWNQNPWWAAHQFQNDDTRDRVITSNLARFELTDFLYVQGRVGMDWYTRRETNQTPYGTGYARGGSISEVERRQREINLEAILGFDKTFGNFSVNAFAGANQMRRSSETISVAGSNFNIPFFAQVSNGANQSIGYGISEKGINSVYGSLNLGYKNFLYLSGTTRTDWFSTLAAESNEILYPSVGLSLVFSELMNTSDFFTFGKFRASWAQVGGDTDPYKLDLTYGLGQGYNGQPNANIQQSSIPNAGLIPLTSTEFEIGVDLRFLNNRLGLDLTYYNQTTTDDILDAAIAITSGFSATSINIGEMRNSGVEMLLTGTPIRKNDFSWDVSLNLAYNDNEVVNLAPGITGFRTGEPRTRWAFTNNIVGRPFSTITGFTQRMINGQPVFNPQNGQPLQGATAEILGQGVHKWSGGLTNEINFKNVYADFLIDFKFGGEIYSGTNVRMVGNGTHKMTVEPTSGLGFVSEGRDKVTVTGVDPEGNAFTKELDATLVPGFWGAYSQLSDRFMYDASFIKLRQISVGYRLPRKLLDKTPVQSANLSFVARNLFLLWDQLENVDPESNYNNTNGQGLDYFGAPQTRSYGLNLKVTF